MSQKNEIYDNFKSRVKARVAEYKNQLVMQQAAKAAKKQKWEPDYIFGIRDSDDDTYSNLLFYAEQIARQEAEKLFYDLCQKHRVTSFVPASRDGAGCPDMVIEQDGKQYKIDLRMGSRPAAEQINRMQKHADVWYVFLWKNTPSSYEALARLSGELPGATVMTFTDLIARVVNERVAEQLEKNMLNFSEEMHDVIGYRVSENCTEAQLGDVRAMLEKELLSYSYEDMLSTKTHLPKLTFQAVFDNFKQNLDLILSKRDFAQTFLTSEWLFRNHKETQGTVDYSYMVTGYIKAIEELLCDIILVLGQNRTIGENRILITSRDPVVKAELMLGNMRIFLDHNGDLLIDGTAQPCLMNQLQYWTDHIRNGYLHKDNIYEFETVRTIRRETFLVLMLILGAIDLSETDRQDLLGIT